MVLSVKFIWNSIVYPFFEDAWLPIPREHLKILRQCFPASAALTTQSPTSRLPSTPAPVVDYDGGPAQRKRPHRL